MEGLKAAYNAYKSVNKAYDAVESAIDNYGFGMFETGLDALDSIKSGWKHASDYTDSFFRPDEHPQFKPMLPKPELSDEFLAARKAREAVKPVEIPKQLDLKKMFSKSEMKEIKSKGPVLDPPQVHDYRGWDSEDEEKWTTAVEDSVDNWVGSTSMKSNSRTCRPIPANCGSYQTL